MIQSCGEPAEKDICASREVACQDCGLDPLCQVLEYGEQDGEAVSAILQRRQPIQRGALLFSTNQSFFAVFAVKSGSFKAVSLDFTGKERVVGLFLPGDLIGVEGIANQVYLYAVRALEESSVCRLEIDHLAQSGRSTEKLQDALIRLLGHEIVMNRIVTTSLIQQNAEQRLSAFLLSISKRYGLRGLPELQFELRMSRSDIGSYLGLARETVSRVLNKFQKSGLIGLRNHVVRVLNREGLEKVTAVRMKLP